MSDHKPHSKGKKQDDHATAVEGHFEEKSKQQKKTGANSNGSKPFSKLLEGVMFVLSGFVNPERSTLRSKALAMGAEYRADWTSDCTLLICAFPNTPKFRQVEAECGTIVSKDWITECYSQKKLVEIERFLMHVGKPWRKTSAHPPHSKDQDKHESDEVSEESKRRHRPKMDGSLRSKAEARGNALDQFSPSKLKDLAIKDLNETVLWLEKQEEKPEPGDIRTIAAEGIVTCLQDAIDALERNQKIQLVTDTWMIVPNVVKELVRLDTGNGKGLLTGDELLKLTIDCKHAYQLEFCSLTEQAKDGEMGDIDRGFDSESTIEMTEEEIDLAFKGLASL